MPVDSVSDSSDEDKGNKNPSEDVDTPKTYNNYNF